jgi:hypothetical protein
MLLYQLFPNLPVPFVGDTGQRSRRVSSTRPHQASEASSIMTQPLHPSSQYHILQDAKGLIKDEGQDA